MRKPVFPTLKVEKSRQRQIQQLAKLAILSIFVQVFFVLTPFPENAALAGVMVRWVDDGDTIVLAGGERVRYVGIDAPEIAHGAEPAEPYGVAALNFNKKIVLGRRISLELADQRRDHYGRLLAYVFLEDGTFVNGEMIRQGYAHLLRRQAKLRYWERLLNLQRLALQEKRGIWSLPVFDPEKFYRGNKSSWVFHRPGCQFGLKTAASNRVRFNNRYEALYQGFSPGRRCKP